MKKIQSLLLLLSFISISFAQVLDPVKWTFEKESLGNNEYNLVFNANIDDGWYVYSQFLDPDGPIPTSFTYEKNSGVTILGKISENGDKVKEGFDKLFEMNIKKFGHGAKFIQKVKVLDGASIAGYLEFMTCDDEKCLPPEYVEFSFDFKNSPAKETLKEAEDVKSELKKAAENTKALVSENNKETNEVSETEQEDILPVETKSSGVLDPVKWKLNTTVLEGNKALLTYTANLEKGWSIYSQDLENLDGPVPTSFSFDKNENVKWVEGSLKETSEHTYEGFDKMFEMNIKKFKESVMFTKEIDITKKEGVLKGYLEFMSCDDEKCLPPAFVDYEIDLATLKTKIGDELSVNNLNEKEEVVNDLTKNLLLKDVDLENPISQCGEVRATVTQEKKSFWIVFLMGLGGGLIALMTPCVFPMIPLTVSFFTKGSQGKKGLVNAFLYGFFIILVYVLLSVPFHILDGLDPNILNNISTNVWLNLLFFAIFIFFAFSFFGFYEIELPSSFADKSSKAEGAGGILGIFFMAVTLAIVSFSCTGPILGMLIGSLASSGGAGAWQLTAGMAGFGVAFALPFTVFAAFPKFLNALPSSGGWMNTVKVVLGFIEIALALKFLSNADLVKNWGFLRYEVFIGLWIIIFAGLALYFFGKIKFPHDSPIHKLSKARIILGTITSAFVIYLFTAFMYNEDSKTFQSLSLLSGLAPPAGYSFIHENHCPQNFACFHDYDEALEYAIKVDKPLLLDFTGHACVNCRKVEETIWNQPQIHKIIDENYVLVSLYVDEAVDLPKEDQITVFYNGKDRKLRTVGNKWAFMEYANFNQASQPYYVLLSNDGKLLNNPIGYSSNSDYVDQYEEFLKCGIKANESLK